MFLRVPILNNISESKYYHMKLHTDERANTCKSQTEDENKIMAIAYDPKKPIIHG